MVKLDFNPEQEDFELQPGRYKAVAVASGTKTSASGNTYTWMDFRITEGEHEGFSQRLFLNLDHPNPKAVKIAARKLKSLMAATGLPDPQDTDEFFDIPVVMVLAAGRNGGGLEISGFEPAGGSATPAAGRRKQPWEK